MEPAERKRVLTRPLLSNGVPEKEKEERQQRDGGSCVVGHMINLCRKAQQGWSQQWDITHLPKSLPFPPHLVI